MRDYLQKRRLDIPSLPTGSPAVFLISKPHTRVLAQIFGLRKRPSQFGRALSNKRESRRERNMPKNAGNSPHGGTKYPVSSVNSKARNFEVEISAPREGFELKHTG